MNNCAPGDAKITGRARAIDVTPDNGKAQGRVMRAGAQARHFVLGAFAVRFDRCVSAKDCTQPATRRSVNICRRNALPVIKASGRFDGIPPIVGWPEASFVEIMNEYRIKERPIRSCRRSPGG